MTGRKKILAIAAALTLCVATVGFTVAYFTDYENARGGATIELSGQTRLEEEMDGNDKLVSIVNTGETDMIVRVHVYSDDGRTQVDESNTDWIKGADGWYYYRYILAAGADGAEGDRTSTLKVFVKTDDPDAAPDFDVLVAHESSQAIYDGQSEPGADDTDLKLVAPEGWNAAAVSQIGWK